VKWYDAYKIVVVGLVMCGIIYLAYMNQLRIINNQIDERVKQTCLEVKK
jgi:hypothetical protein